MIDKLNFLSIMDKIELIDKNRSYMVIIKTVSDWSVINY